MQPALREDECGDRAGGLRRVVRPLAARLQARQPECGAALQMFVAGLATAAELFAPLGHGKAPASGEYHESIDLFHKVTLVQGVALGVTYLPGLSVTYLAGSNPPWLFLIPAADCGARFQPLRSGK